MKLRLLAVAVLAVFLTAGCAGVRYDTKKRWFTAHAESFHFFGIYIPDNEMDMAMKKVPKGAKIVTMGSTAADWESFVGFFGNLFGWGSAMISGELGR